MTYLPSHKTHEWVHSLNRFVGFHHRSRFPATIIPLGAKALVIPPVKLPIDWTKNGALSFPYDLNDQLGDCMYAAACHVDNTWTGNVGAESSFDLAALRSSYLALSGGDNGLDEQEITQEWQSRGLCGVSAAKAFAHLDIDPNDAALMQACQYYFGHVSFTLSVPSAWVNNFSTGCVWDAPATPNPNNGHGVMFNGVDSTGRYKLQTWGSHCWITPAGVRSCDPGAWVNASLRWFNSAGIAPNGYHYDDLSKIWQDLGGSAWPKSPFPPAPTPTPAPTPAPTPTPTPTPTPAPTPTPQGPLTGSFQAAMQRVEWKASLSNPGPVPQTGHSGVFRLGEYYVVWSSGWHVG